jgi:hypothetical protein
MPPRRSPRFRCRLLELDEDVLRALLAAGGPSLRGTCVALSIMADQQSIASSQHEVRARVCECQSIVASCERFVTESAPLQERLQAVDDKPPEQAVARQATLAILDSWRQMFVQMSQIEPCHEDNMRICEEATSLSGAMDAALQALGSISNSSDALACLRRKRWLCARLMRESRRASLNTVACLNNWLRMKKIAADLTRDMERFCGLV